MKFSCTIFRFKDGIPIAPTKSGRIRVETLERGVCTLTVYDVKESDSGAYRCVATNILGSCNTACTVSVRGEKKEKKVEGEAPKFIRGIIDSWVETKSDGVLKCMVTGEPRPTIKWFKDGVLLKASGRVQIEEQEDGTCLLHVKNAALADEGMYKCLAENKHGSDKTIGTLHIESM